MSLGRYQKYVGKVLYSESFGEWWLVESFDLQWVYIKLIRSIHPSSVCVGRKEHVSYSWFTGVVNDCGGSTFKLIDSDYETKESVFPVPNSKYRF